MLTQVNNIKRLKINEAIILQSSEMMIQQAQNNKEMIQLSTDLTFVCILTILIFLILLSIGMHINYITQKKVAE
jgi:hypothetical protein